MRRSLKRNKIIKRIKRMLKKKRRSSLIKKITLSLGLLFTILTLNKTNTTRKASLIFV
jgi:hypothetical protein